MTTTMITTSGTTEEIAAIDAVLSFDFGLIPGPPPLSVGHLSLNWFIKSSSNSRAQSSTKRLFLAQKDALNKLIRLDPLAQPSPISWPRQT